MTGTGRTEIWPGQLRPLLALTGSDEVFRVQADVEAAVASVAGCRRRYRWRRLAVRAARPGEGSAFACGYRVIAGRGGGCPGGVPARPGARMTDSRAVVVRGQVAARAAAHGGRAWVADVCAVAVSPAALSGAWVVAARGGDPDFVTGVTGVAGGQLAEVQLMPGEGAVP